MTDTHTLTYVDLLGVDPEAATEYFVQNFQLIDHKQIPTLFRRKHKRYYYLVTFTIRNDILDSQCDNIHKYVFKQFTGRKDALGIMEAWGVREKTKRGRDHWHVSVKTSKCLKKDRFAYYIKKYGSIQINPTKTKTLKYGIEYINKDNPSTRLV